MNSKAKFGKICKEYGCAEIAGLGASYCDKHSKEHKTHRHDQRRQVRLKLYTSSAWKRLRKAKLAQDPICEHCKRKAANVVHHKIRARLDAAAQLDIENLEALCDSCHNAESQREGQEDRGGGSNL